MAALALAPVALWAAGTVAAGTSAAGTGSGSAVAAQQSRAPRWLPPLGFTLEVATPFRAPAHRYAAGHRGFDLPAQPGEVVFSPAAGTVTFAGKVVDREVVSVRVDAFTVVSLEPVSSGLSAGDTVAAGAALGEIASGGHCDGECIHLGVRVNDWYVNPMRYFRDKPRLLPWND